MVRSMLAKLLRSSLAQNEQRNPCSAGARRPPNPMHIVFGGDREVEVDDVRNALDVDAACGDVSGHEHARFAALEVRERALTRPL